MIPNEIWKPSRIISKPIFARLIISSSLIVMGSHAWSAKPTSAELTKTNCSELYVSKSQSAVKQACEHGAELDTSTMKAFEPATAIQKQCASDFQEARVQQACGVGASLSLISDGDLHACQTLYPNRIEIDLWLQEACYVGWTQQTLQPKKSAQSLCHDISRERFFLAPCLAGAGLAYPADQVLKTFRGASSSTSTSSTSTASSISPSEGVRPTQALAKEIQDSCGKYFDQVSFHSAYRACLGGMAFLAKSNSELKPGSKKNIYQTWFEACRDLTSDEKSDTEKAACLVGADIASELEESGNVPKYFAKCGENKKVTYEDRNYLACLVAGTIRNQVSGVDASQKACRNLYSSKKSKNRQYCEKAIAKF